MRVGGGGARPDLLTPPAARRSDGDSVPDLAGRTTAWRTGFSDRYMDLHGSTTRSAIRDSQRTLGQFIGLLPAGRTACRLFDTYITQLAERRVRASVSSLSAPEISCASPGRRSSTRSRRFPESARAQLEGLSGTSGRSWRGQRAHTHGLPRRLNGPLVRPTAVPIRSVRMVGPTAPTPPGLVAPPPPRRTGATSSLRVRSSATDFARTTVVRARPRAGRSSRAEPAAADRHVDAEHPAAGPPRAFAVSPSRRRKVTMPQRSPRPPVMDRATIFFCRSERPPGPRIEGRPPDRSPGAGESRVAAPSPEAHSAPRRASPIRAGPR